MVTFNYKGLCWYYSVHTESKDIYVKNMIIYNSYKGEVLNLDVKDMKPFTFEKVYIEIDKYLKGLRKEKLIKLKNLSNEDW